MSTKNHLFSPLTFKCILILGSFFFNKCGKIAIMAINGYIRQCSPLVDFLNTETQWQSLFTQDYYRTNTILTTFCDKRFLLPERLTAITENLRLAEEKMGRSFASNY